jgi:ribosomal-protein-alanine N-acetyltransferase
MEFANEQADIYRQANPGDAGSLRTLLEEADYKFRYVDWYEPANWMDSPSFAVAELQSGEMRRFSSCLAVSAEVPPAAWVRLAAARHRSLAEQQLAGLFKQIIPHLHNQGVNQVGWLAAPGWPEDLLKDVGFNITNWITSYQVKTQDRPIYKSKDIMIRPASRGDVSALAEIEFLAFEPIWRLNKLSLESAFTQALSYDAAFINGEAVGFQISVRGFNHQSAHLVRITVHPDFQGKGIGSALLSRTIEGYQQGGIEFVSLNTQIDNFASHRLYERFGFTNVGDQIPLYMLKLNSEE